MASECIIANVWRENIGFYQIHGSPNLGAKGSTLASKILENAAALTPLSFSHLLRVRHVQIESRDFSTNKAKFLGTTYYSCCIRDWKVLSPDFPMCYRDNKK